MVDSLLNAWKKVIKKMDWSPIIIPHMPISKIYFEQRFTKHNLDWKETLLKVLYIVTLIHSNMKFSIILFS